jgi:hypothetical protein
MGIDDGEYVSMKPLLDRLTMLEQLELVPGKECAGSQACCTTGQRTAKWLDWGRATGCQRAGWRSNLGKQARIIPLGSGEHHL